MFYTSTNIHNKFIQQIHLYGHRRSGTERACIHYTFLIAVLRRVGRAEARRPSTSLLPPRGGATMHCSLSQILWMQLAAAVLPLRLLVLLLVVVAVASLKLHQLALLRLCTVSLVGVALVEV